MWTRAFHASVEYLASRVWASTALIVALTALALGGYFAPKWPERLADWAGIISAESEEDTTEANSRQRRSNTNVPFNGDAVLVIESDQLFSQNGLNALRAIVAELEALDYVRSVTWLDSVPSLNVFGLGDPIFPRVPGSPERFEKAKQRALEHPFILGQFLSADARTTIFLVSFDFLYVPDDDACVQGIRETAERVMRSHPNVMCDFTMTGRVPITLSSVRGSDADRLQYQLIGYGIIITMSIVLFRGLSAVLIVTIASALGVFWTIGLSRYFDVDFNPLVNVILPILVSLVGFTDGVHLMTNIRRRRAKGASGREAAIAGLREVGLACALTSLTTAIGLGSLMLADHPIVQEFGQCSVVGVIATFFAVITAVPLACTSPLGKNLHRGYDKSLVEQHLSRISVVIDFVLRHKKTISWAGVAALLLMSAICLSLRPDQRIATTLPRSSEAALGIDKLDAAFGGLEAASVNISWKTPRAWDDLEVARFIGRVDEVLAQEPLIGNPTSIRRITAAVAGAPPQDQHLSLAALLPDRIAKLYYDSESQTAAVTFRVQDVGIAKYDEVFQRVQQKLAELNLEFPDFFAELGGGAVWRWENLYTIVVDLLVSLGTAVVIIFIVLTMAYRSLIIGLISIVPNIFPLAVAGVFLVWAGQSLEIVTVCAFTVCLGIAVDDSIHFLTRYQEVMKDNPQAPTDVAIRHAFTDVGTALIITTVVLVAGFSSVFLADSRDHLIFVTLGTITITFALFADLLILPAMLSLWDRPGRREEAEENPAGVSSSNPGHQ